MWNVVTCELIISDVTETAWYSSYFFLLKVSICHRLIVKVIKDVKNILKIIYIYCLKAFISFIYLYKDICTIGFRWLTITNITYKICSGKHRADYRATYATYTCQLREGGQHI